jgi:hypothetical protein
MGSSFALTGPLSKRELQPLNFYFQHNYMHPTFYIRCTAFTNASTYIPFISYVYYPPFGFPTLPCHMALPSMPLLSPVWLYWRLPSAWFSRITSTPFFYFLADTGSRFLIAWSFTSDQLMDFTTTGISSTTIRFDVFLAFLSKYFSLNRWHCSSGGILSTGREHGRLESLALRFDIAGDDYVPVHHCESSGI